jgi:dihydroorotase
MKVHLPKARIVQPHGPLNGEIRDLWFENGALISPPTKPTGDDVDTLTEGCFVSAGWVDLRARSFDPGMPERETLSSLLHAADAGGYEQVGILPVTEPTTDHSAVIEYAKNRSQGAHSRPLFIGALSRRLEGRELAELEELKESGAVAFSDGGRPIANGHFLKVAMEYSAMLGKPLILRPDDPFLFGTGAARESMNSFRAGMAGIPAVSEVIGIDRIAELARYTACSVHLTSISTKEGLDRLRQHKSKDYPLTADVAIAHLALGQEGLLDFDTNWKQLPPLGSEDDQKALIEGLCDGSIDAVVSDHHPVNVEQKVCTYQEAEEGISSIQATHSLLRSVPGLSEERFVELMSTGPRRILGLSEPDFQPGGAGGYTLYRPDSKTQYATENWHSTSSNFPFLGQTLPGAVLGCMRP